MRLHWRWIPLGLAGLALALAAPRARAGPPKRPEDIPLEAFAQLPATAAMQLSPGGGHRAMLHPVEGRWHLVIQPIRSIDKRGIEGGKSIAVPPLRQSDVQWFRFATDTRLVFAVAFTGHRLASETVETRLLAIDADGQNLTALVQPARMKTTGSRITQELPLPQIQDDVIDFLWNDPDHILVSLDEDHDAKDEVRRIDIGTGDYHVVQGGRDRIQRWMTDRVGEVRVGWGVDRDQRRMRYQDPEKGWVDVTDSPWRQQGWRPLAFTQDPRIAYAAGPGPGGRSRIVRLDLSRGEIVEEIFAHELVDVERLVQDPLDDTPIGVGYVVDRPRVHYFDPDWARIQRMVDKALPDTTNQIGSRTRDRRLFLIQASSDVEPGVYYVLDLEAKQMHFAMETRPGLAPELMSPMRAVRYPARDGLEIPAYLTVPKGKQAASLPVVVMPHGGPDARDAIRFDYWTQFLASRGYAAFQPNFRGSSGYGAAFRRAGEKEWGGKMQQDVSDGVAWLVEQGIADPARICILGGSYGGYAALMGAIQTPDRYRCAVSINGPTDLELLVADADHYVGGRLWARSIGEDRSDLRDVSPYHQAGQLRIPTLLIQAKDDARVPDDHARKLARRLRKLERDVRLVELDDGGHTLDTEAARLATLRAAEAFLAEHLTAPAPEEP